LLLHLISLSDTHTHTHTHERTHLVGAFGRKIDPSQRPLPDITQHSQQTDIHAPGRIRIRTLSKRAATDPRLRPRGHLEQLSFA